MAQFEDPSSRLELLVAIATPAFARRWLRMIKSLTGDLSLEDIERFVSRQILESAFLAALEQHALTFGNLWGEVFARSGQLAGDFIGNSLEIAVNFDTVNFRALTAMQKNSLRLVRGFVDEQRRATRRALTDGIRRGINPRAMAREFRGSIGLTRKQVGFVNNYRRQLENLDIRALNRQLRDRRFDGTLRRAVRNNEPLTRGQIDRMVDRYRQRWVKFRAETISRTEALRSVHQGNQEMYRQAIQNGQLDAQELIRQWDTSKDGRVRDPAHTGMEGQQRGINEPFVSGLGNALMYPGDTAAPAEETVQCRCAVTTRFTDSAKQRTAVLAAGLFV